jgi:predicted DNA-binding protein
MRGIKYIQTRIDLNLHAKLKSISKHKNMKLKEIIREAIVEYIKKFERKIEKDSFFKVIGSFETKEGDWSEKDNWRK